MSSKFFSCALFLLAIVFCISLSNNKTLPVQANPTTGTEAGEWRCWNLGTADSCQRTLHGVDVLSANYAWAVGEEGLALRWNGTRWLTVNTGTNARLTGVSIVSETEVWAVGGTPIPDENDPFVTYRLTVLRWDGTAWHTIPTPEFTTSAQLWSIDMLSADYGMLVGGNGAFLWDGHTWDHIYGGLVFGLSLLAPDDGWVVGWQGRLLHWDGHEFTEHDHPWPHPGTPPTMLDVEMIATDDVWAGGESNQLWHWDGQEWQVVPGPYNAGPSLVRSVSMTAPDQGWALTLNTNHGASGLWQWDGETWSLISHVTSAWELAMLSATDGWVVGQNSQITRWDGGAWVSPPTQVPLNLTYQALDALSPTAVWAVGRTTGYSSAIIYWDGQQWSPQSTSSNFPLNAVSMLTPDLGWAVGNATALQWDGQAWQSVTVPSNLVLQGVDVIAADDVWVAGYQSFNGIVWRWDGKEWHEVEAISGVGFFDISMLNSSEGWAVGEQSTVLRWDGETWNDMAAPDDAWLYRAVQALDSNNVWVLGDSSDVLRWDGDTWHQEPLPEESNLRGFHFSAPDSGWAVGQDGLIFHWDGIEWTLVETPTSSDYNAVVGLPNGNAWAVGSGAILRHTPPSPFGIYLPLVTNQ